MMHIEMCYVIRWTFQMWWKDKLSNKHVGTLGHLGGMCG